MKLPLSRLKPGMKLERDVKLADGRLLLLAGFAIRPFYIRKLEAFHIDYVYVDETALVPVEEYDAERLYKHATDTLKNVFLLANEGKGTNVSDIRDTVSEILHKVMEDETVMLQLTGIRDIDNYTFLHSVDVCIYSTIIGKRLGYGQEPLLDLGMGAILHDIGKCKVPIEILQKPGRLTDGEFHIMKLHAVHGYDVIRSIYGLNTKIANIAFQHHEKWDGSGYPLGLTDHRIDPLARIVALADVYDALTSDRVYKTKILPHVAAEYIKSNAGTLFDPYIVELFIDSIASYTEGTLVLLNTGELGSIMAPDSKDGGGRQKIHVFSNKSGPPI